MQDLQKHVIYQKFYKTKAGKLVEMVNNKRSNLADDEDLILFQAVEANLGFNVFRYSKDTMDHVKWFEERDQAIEFAFVQSMSEQMKLDAEKTSKLLEPYEVREKNHPLYKTI